MKHLNLKKLMLATGMVMGSLAGNAQVYTPLAFAATAGTNNHYSDYVGLRFTVSNPQLECAYTTANDGSGTAGQWGAALTAGFTGPIVKAGPDSLACTGTLNSLAGAIALIYRGDCEFGAKAMAAQTQGAAGVIIVNNQPGIGPVGMGAGSQGSGVTIPVFMISKEDGDAINAVLNQSGSSTVTIQPWLSGTDEIAIIKGGTALWHNYAIPWHQLGTSNGNPAAYKQQIGAYIANFGSNAQTGVKLEGKVEWYPTGSSTPTLVHQDDFTMSSSFAASDSIRALYTDVTPDLHATGTGRFAITHTVSSTTDGIPGNNTVTDNVYVTDNIFCKSRYDFVNGRPIGNIGYRSGSGDPITWGPLYYVAKGGGYAIEKLQFSVSQENQPVISILNQGLYILKWQDGSGGGPLDGLVDNAEVTLEGSAYRQFNGTTADSSGKFWTADVDTNGTGWVMMDDNSWYWVVADLQTGFFLTCDGKLNYLPREVLYNKNVGGSTYEQFAPLFFGDFTAIQSNPTDGAFPFPFEGTVVLDSMRFAHQNQGMVPSIAMLTTMFPTTTKNVTSKEIGTIDLYPNPASDKLNVSVKLNAKADKVTYRVLSVMGQIVSREEKANIQNDEFTLNTSSYAPGNYYLIVNVGGSDVFKKFTVAGK
ncbi:MAG TPA: PA domain-containing protein [Flavipsychrobacter sp.]|nr:PA domain-containing protein [Flavipsychrobacter sp.]